MTSIKLLAESLNKSLVLPQTLDNAIAKIEQMHATGQLTVSTALEDRQISFYKKEAGKQALGTIIMVWVLKLASSFKMSEEKNLNEDDAGDIAEAILHDYWYLKLAEIKVFFDRAKKGKYGQVYDRFEQQTLFVWLEKYLAEREYEIQRAREQKHKEITELPKKLEDYDPKAQAALHEIALAFKRPLATRLLKEPVTLNNHPNKTMDNHRRLNTLCDWFPNEMKKADAIMKRFESIRHVEISLNEFLSHQRIQKLESIIAERTKQSA